MKTTVLVLALAGIALASPALASELTCNINKRDGRQVTYEFAPNTDRTMVETGFSVDGKKVTLSPPPVWLRTKTDPEGLSFDLTGEGGWSIEVDGDDATLRQDILIFGSGRCGAPYSADPDASRCGPHPCDVTSNNTVPITYLGNTAYIDATLGSVTIVRMVIDTGATDMTVSRDYAEQLRARGEATVANSADVLLADGSHHQTDQIVIKTVKIGTRTVYNVKSWVMDDPKATMLLGMGVLGQFGKFTIDTAHSQLIFG